MFINSKVANAIKVSLLCGSAASLLTLPFSSIGAETSAVEKKEAEVERISVTGSRIFRPGATSASPISSVGAGEIKMLQTPQVEEVLRQLPSTIPGDGANVNNGTAGAATVNLRGLGEERTLVLMNGRRMVPFNFDGIVDTNSVPVALIESVDVVTGGASAVYGSDAIAGAVNFVMKRNFEGVELSYNHSETGDGDGDTDNISLTLGSNLADDRGNVALSLNWTDRKAVLLGDRELGQVGITSEEGYLSYLAGNGPLAPIQGCGGPDVVESGGSTTAIPTRFSIVGAGVDGQFREDGTIGSECSEFNFNPYNYYQTPQERWGATAIAHYDINDDHTVYTRASFSSTSVKQQIAPSGTFGTVFNLPLANPLIGDEARQWIIDGANDALANGLLNTGDVTNWNDVNNNNVVDEADYLAVQLRRRTLELGARSTDYQTDLFQIVVGAEGTLYEDWAYDVSYQYGESNRTNIFSGYTNVANLQNALDTTDGVTCNNGDSTCVPIDLFGGFGTITDEAAAYSSATALLKQAYSQEIITATVNGPVNFIEVPSAGEPLSLSFGYEHRQEVGETTPDECLKLAPISCLGGNGGNILPIEGGFKVSEFFVEGVLPVFDGAEYADILDIEFAYRSADYDSVGSNDTWKLGFSWKPSEDLLIRVMKQSATRAPNVGEIASPVVTSLDNTNLDPCSVANAGNIDDTLRNLCISTGMTDAQVGNVANVISSQVDVFAGTNPDVLPEAEEADTFTAGFVYTNSDLNDLTLTVDYYNIDVANTIGEFTADQILRACYEGGNTTECAKINRIGGSLTVAGSGIDTFTTNLLYRKAEGIELSLNFSVPLEDMGELKFDTIANHYLSNERQAAAELDVIDCVGAYGQNCSPTPETKLTQRVTWLYEDLTASLLWRYTSALDMEADQAATTFEAFTSIPSYSYIDLYGSYTINDNINVTFGIDNVLDKDAPIVGNEAGSTTFNSGNTFPASYSTLGRIYKAGVTLSF
ncbi:TonB-dependent receptor domain-containing protein [Pseudocolwellia agarivorans]|uniref:TonB-dependent receptor domain-containing protein n=1 Tax=Pseudocolwellia agarivorans TaxID=1911682 RepID=UPI003F88323E